MVDEQSLYGTRFDEADRIRKDRIWAVLCSRFFQQWVRPEDRVLDIGAGYCEFINHIEAREKHALDLNPETVSAAAADVVVHTGAAKPLPFKDGSFDVVFASNFFEHIPSKEDLVGILKEVRRALRSGGRFLIMQPNYRYAYREYWDFLDHHIPLSERSMVEALRVADLRPTKVVPRFLPFTTKSRLPQRPWLVAVYLRLPLVWRLLGKQMFIVAEPGVARD